MVPIKGKKGIWILTVAAALLVVATIWMMMPKVELFEIAINSEGGMQSIAPWKDENGNLYIFLPGYVQLKDASFLLNTDTVVTIDGKSLYENMSCDSFACDVAYDVEYKVFGTKKKSQITFVRSGGVATMFITTETGTMEYIHENKGNEETGAVRLYDETGCLNCTVDQLTVKGRGNASWTDSEKKAYTVSLPREADFLGMGKAQTWILLANAVDHSHIRNKIVYDFAAEIGLPYSPESQWVDLYLNGEYAGLYQLSEKNEVHPERVNIASGEGFLVSIELRDRLEEQGISYVETDGGQALRIHYPENPTQDTMSAMAAQWQSIENAILSENGIDPVSGQSFWEMADMHSWVKSYLVDEIFGNLDCFKASRYFYFNADGDQKIYAGPVWDYDKSLGNDTDQYWSLTNPRVQVLYRYAYDPQSAHVWAEELYERSWFREQIKAIFKEELLSVVDSLINTGIQDYADQIRSAARMDRIRWLSAEEGSFDHEVSKVTVYLEEHVTFLKELWLEDKEYCQVSVLKIGCDQFYTVPKGKCLQELPAVQDQETKRFVGWYYCDTNELFDITKPITEDVQIYARWEEKSIQKMKQAVNLLPLGMIAVIGLGLLAVEWRRSRRTNSPDSV